VKLHLSHPEGLNQITSCGTGFVVINGTRHSRSVLVTPRDIMDEWPVGSLQSLAPTHLLTALELSPELVLLGTGATLQFPPSAVLRPLIDAHIGFEVMDTPAACRTYNILMAESRRVLAALIIG
jgi:uncharacterized protein